MRPSITGVPPSPSSLTAELGHQGPPPPRAEVCETHTAAASPPTSIWAWANAAAWPPKQPNPHHGDATHARGPASLPPGTRRGLDDVPRYVARHLAAWHPDAPRGPDVDEQGTRGALSPRWEAGGAQIHAWAEDGSVPEGMTETVELARRCGVGLHDTTRRTRLGPDEPSGPSSSVRASRRARVSGGDQQLRMDQTGSQL